jgi:Tfp pilus assembly protein PilO
MNLLISILFLAVSGILFWGYIDPTYANVRELRVEENSYNQALNRSRELLNVRDQLVSRFNAFPQASLERLEKLIPDHVDNVRLILDLDAIALKYGMRVRNVTISSDQTRIERGALGSGDKPYESVILSFSVSGPYDTFRQFVVDLEQSLRLVDVVGLSFTANDVGIYNYTLSIKTYWLKP